MGVYSDLLTNAKSWDAGGADGISVAGDRVITKQLTRWLNKQGDAPYPDGYEADDEVETVEKYNCTVTGGNFTLTVTLKDEDAFTTANIAYDAVAADIEDAINTAATAASVTDWTNGDITVALTGDLNANTVTITYDGASVTEKNHTLVTFTDVDLSGGSTGAVSETQKGVVAVDEVQSIGAYLGTVDGGNFTLGINIAGEANGVQTTANIVHNAAAATIEGAINTVCTGNVSGWVNGDITVTGGDLTSAAVVLTYDGANFAATDQGVVVQNDVDLTGVGTVGAVAEATKGLAGTDEVQNIATWNGTVSSGNFTLTINIAGEANGAQTTANIAYDATAATIEGAVNTVATGNIAHWTNGDISVSGGNLATSPVVLTYDGDAVKGMDQNEVAINDVDLGGGGSPGAVTTTTPGVDKTPESQNIATYNGTVSGGNYTIQFTILGEANGAQTTANIAYDAAAAAIEGAINTVATGNIADWTNGDISVTGGDLTANPIVLTFDGYSVNGADHIASVIADVDMTGPGTPGAVTTTNEGVTPVDEIQSIAIYPVDVASGNYTLQVTITGEANGAFTTANIAYDANAVTIETAIDVAATALPVAAWTNGDISVADGPLTTNAVVLTFDGTSVDGGDHIATIVGDVDLKGGTPGTAAVTTNGQSVRLALAALNTMGVIPGPPPEQGSTSGLTATSLRATNPWLPGQEAMIALAKQAALDDGTDGMYAALMEAMGFDWVLAL